VKKQRIVIIGGGLSGLTLAYLLEKKNYEITLIEASPRLGGRIQIVYKGSFIISNHQVRTTSTFLSSRI